MARLLANKNLPRMAIESLRDSGHDVLWARESMSGASDPEVLERAVDENRILLTFDKDFGKLPFHGRLPADCGIILLRFPLLSPESVAASILALFEEKREWEGHFTVVDPTRIRVTPLSVEE